MLAANPTRDVPMERALRDVNTSWNAGPIPRLLASREEAKAITDLTSFATNFKAIDFELSTSVFPGKALDGFVHQATAPVGVG